MKQNDNEKPQQFHYTISSILNLLGRSVNRQEVVDLAKSFKRYVYGHLVLKAFCVTRTLRYQNSLYETRFY